MDACVRVGKYAHICPGCVCYENLKAVIPQWQQAERSKCRTECGPEEGGWLWAQRTFSAQVWYDPQPLDVDQPRVQESL